MTMEEFLRKHFGCKKPFRKFAKKAVNEFGEEEWEYLTENGFKVYEEFISLLYDLAELCESLEITGFINPDEVNSAVDDFDEFVSTGHC